MSGEKFITSSTEGADKEVTPAAARTLLGSSGRDFATVAEAEAATYTEPEHCSVTETGKAYIYNASSAATVDGDYVLSVGDAVGRLLCVRALVDQLRTDFGNSVFLGQGAGLNDDGTDNRNVGVGINALGNNTTGANNTANGYLSLYNNTTGANNTANGVNSLVSNTTGNNNTANGYLSLYNNTTGANNTANGFASLYSNTTGTYNTANGYSSLYSNTTGTYNTANGYSSLFSNTTGTYNTANGYYSLYSNTTGTYNTANGYYSLYSNTTGYSNTANGFNSGRYIANGISPNQTSSNSVYLGGNTKALADGDINETVVGYDAIGNGSNTVTIGNDSVTNNYFNGEIKTTCTTSDSSSFAIKNEDSTSKLLESLRADGLKYHDGAIARPALTITADLTLTVSTRAFLLFNFAATGGVVTLPASPEDGQEFHPENIGSFSVTLARNGKLINGSASNVSISSQANGYYRYDAASGGWWSFD